MKFPRIPFAVLLCVLLVGCSTSQSRLPQKPKTTFSSFDQSRVGEKIYGKAEINMKGIGSDDFLRI